MKRIDRIAETLRRVGGELTAAEVAELVGTTRANASHDLNRLADLGMVEKLPGRPVRFRWRGEPAGTAATADGRDGAWARDVGIFDRITGARGSLAKQVEQARAAILYPPRGLHTLLLGSTGVGKTLFAELMYQFALESGRLPPDAPFVAFNCADYAANPQLLMGQLFGVARGAFSGADRDRPGLVEKADGGILFLDEVHRLPPEGQEMLFYLIDRGEYRRLGEAERVRRSSVLLIAATTEPPESALLSTFYRRIPMVIHLPDLRDRPVEERRELIHRFVLEEQERIGVRVVLSPDALELLLRYECPGNIGQLRTDIQLACAHAYLNYLSGKSRVVWIAPDALPEHVRRGAGPGVSPSGAEPGISSGDVGPGMSPGGAGESTLARGEGGVRPPVDLPADLPSHVPANLSPDLPAALPPDLPDPGPVSRQHDPYRLPAEFYDYLEERVQALRRQGLADREITQRLRGEIEAYFRRFLRTPVQGGGLAREELARVVGEEVVAAAEEMLRYAARRLNREYDPRVLYGLALHIQGTLERIRNGRGVHGHDLAQLHGEYPAEFAVAAGMVTILERRLGVRLPVDETGLLTLFLRSAHSPPEPGEGGVGVLVICHGSATASSMVEFAHALLGVRVARALDVPLEMPPAVVRREAARLVRELDQGKGVLLLVDMGSLVTMVGDLQAETGVAIRAVDRVSTPLVLEAVRKASLPGVTLEEVAAAVADPPAWRAAPRPAVLTVCLTGEGSARQLQRLVEQGVPELAGAGVAVVSLEMVPGRPLGVPAGLVPLAVVGTFDPQLPGVPFIPAVEVLRGPGLLRLRWLLTAAGLLPAGGPTEPAAAPPAPPAFYPPGADGDELPLPPDAIQRVMEALGEELRFVNPRLLVPDILRAMGRLARSLGRSWGEHLLVWVVMHLGAVMDRLVRGEAVPPNPEAELWAERFPEVHAAVREALTELEERYRVRFPPAEVARLTEVAVMETS